jgi:hypothetical protein
LNGSNSRAPRSSRSPGLIVPPLGPLKFSTTYEGTQYQSDFQKRADEAISGAIAFQERVSTTSKKGGDLTFRKDLLCMDVNDRINLTDVGAAMMRGFDIPAFRKDIQREIRQTKQVPSIEQFWSSWLHEMSNAVRTIEAAFRELLDVDGNQEAGILPRRAPTAEEVPEVVET